ncbi:unnamed protein product [Camellia sinensis]
MFTITTLSSPNSLSQKDIRLLSSELIVLEVMLLLLIWMICKSLLLHTFQPMTMPMRKDMDKDRPQWCKSVFSVLSVSFFSISLMESKLRSGTTLIVDRYSFSGVAFSSTKGLDFEWCKMKKWKGWESDTSSLEYQFTNDPARFRFSHQTSFVRRHTRFSRTPGIRWIVAFFRQFFGSVSKVEYITMRNGFINRSMEDDFKVVVGISFPLWVFAVILLLLNVYSWYTLAWISLVPLIVTLCRMGNVAMLGLNQRSLLHKSLNLRSLAAPSFIDEITQRVTQDVESRFTTMIKNLTARVLFLECQMHLVGSKLQKKMNRVVAGMTGKKQG